MRRAVALALMLAGPARAEGLPEGWVALADIAPGIAQDIRYAREFNFTAGVVPGYEAPACILRRGAAEALARVEARLAVEGFRLLVFDCYRPARAVRAFMDWTGGKGPDLGAVFFPGLGRGDLVPQGYIARESSHSRGATVDVGLERLGVPVLRAVTAPGLRCDGDPAVRPRETSLDMGTSFDCFSPLSGAGAGISPEARENRDRLARAMQAEGFRGYDREWWHFRLPGAGTAEAADFAVR